MRVNLARPARPFIVLSLIAIAAIALPVRGSAQQRLTSPFSSLKWRSIGPVNTSGRIDDFAVARVAGQPDAIYVATASGGVFKSTNAGTSWTPVFDEVDAMQSIGDVTVAPSSPNTVWVGTGEANNRQSSSWGDGVYKSTDAGKTWKNMGLTDTKHIGRIVIDPVNANVVYVAALGHLWGANAERGVFKTMDGGATWKKVLYVDADTGATDIVIDPKNPKILVAAMLQRRRTSWGYNGGGPGSGIYKSVDAGATWKRLSKGLPEGDLGRIALDMFPQDPKLIFATVEGRPSGVYRSADAGETWEALAKTNIRPTYFSQIRVDPSDRNRVYMLGSNRGFLVSNDSGKTFVDTGVNGIHGEDHALWVDPDNTNHLIIGGDGGVSISWDRGVTWDFRMNMPIGQFYEIGVDMKTPFTVCGGLQDNGEWCVPSAVRDRNGIAASDAFNIGGGDGFYVKIDPTDNNYAYAESQNGNAGRVNLTTKERSSVRPSLPGQQLRFNWDTPIVISTADPNTIYIGAQMLFRSPDRGATWTAISGDLTTGDDHPAGSENPPADALSRNDGISPFNTITSVSESPLDARVLYVGTQDGNVQMTRDGGKTWTNLTGKFPGVPKYTYVSTVLASEHVAGRAYVTFDGHYTDDFEPYLYKTEDFGQAWTRLGGGPPTSINRVREHPRNANMILVGHEKGLHFSADLGRSWFPLSRVTNFPTVSVDDIVVHPRDNSLVLGTHGRGIWILDDMGPLEAWTAATYTSAAALMPIAPARQMITSSPQAWYGSGTFFAPNPDFNAGINYFIKNGGSGTVQIEISDRFGNLVRTLQGPAATGLNHATWDMRGEAAPPTGAAAAGAPAGRGGGRGGRGGTPQGPLVTPGTYLVSITVPGVAQPLTGQLVVEADPIK
jgi:photosystem II stability/assembly factor-like uncharacterized protein